MDSAAITRLLRRMEHGDGEAAEELYELVYEELRGRAHRLAVRDGAGLTLQPTAIVHEAWLKLAGSAGVEWTDRTHFLAVASRAMRLVLVDHVRSRNTLKRGGGADAVLDAAVLGFEERSTGLKELNEALARLEERDPDLARIVELRFFGGLSLADTAEVLGVSSSTVERGWRLARAWLLAELSPEEEDDEP